MFPQYQAALKPEFEQRKRELVINTPDDAREGLTSSRSYSNGVL